MTKILDPIFQESWSTNIPIALSEAKGGKLKPYTELAVGTGMEKHTFYRDRDYSTGDKAPQFYNNPTYQGTSGEREKYTVSPTSVYAHEMVAWEDMNKSMLSADSNFMRGFANAMSLREDIEIIKAIESKDAELITTGVVGEAITTDNNILAFKQACFLALANVDNANVVEGASSVAITIDVRDYADLMPKGGTEGNMLSSSDFKTYQNASGILVTSLFGCDIHTFKKFNNPAKWGGRTGVVPKGTIYFIPAKTIGFVEWAGGDMNHMEYTAGNEDTYQFMVRKTLGAIAIEPEAIIKMSVQP